MIDIVTQEPSKKSYAFVIQDKMTTVDCDRLVLWLDKQQAGPSLEAIWALGVDEVLTKADAATIGEMLRSAL